MNNDTKELLLLAILLASVSVLLVFVDDTNTAGALGLGSFVWLLAAYGTNRDESPAQQAIVRLPARMPVYLPASQRNELTSMLARIDQQMEQAKAVIAAARDSATKLRAQVTLAEMENARYEVEGKLNIGEKKPHAAAIHHYDPVVKRSLARCAAANLRTKNDEPV